MDEILKGQFQLWLDQNGLEDDAVYQAGLALDQRLCSLCSLPDFLDIEPVINESVSYTHLDVYKRQEEDRMGQPDPLLCLHALHPRQGHPHRL